MTETKSHRILLPMNRTSRRFLRTVNKLRLFFYDEQIKCIPCVDDPFNLLLSTKNMKHNRVKIVKFVYSKSVCSPVEMRYGIEFHGSKDKRMKLLADYLRTDVIESKYKSVNKNNQLGHCVLLPKSISNFMQSKQINRYVNSKFKSMEEQIKLCFPDAETLSKVKSLED